MHTYIDTSHHVNLQKENLKVKTQTFILNKKMALYSPIKLKGGRQTTSTRKNLFMNILDSCSNVGTKAQWSERKSSDRFLLRRIV